MNSSEDFFSQDYESARSRFRTAASDAGARLADIPHKKVRGLCGEDLAVDIALFGDASADNVLVVGSGTHGVEGFCGSGCQLGLMTSNLHRAIHADTALLLVHALNPHGFSHVRRVNEENIDINRNFVRNYEKAPTNPDYDRLHSFLVPDDWFGESKRKADAYIRAFIETEGERAYQAALTGGQYNHPDGIFYGGKSACWSNTTWNGIVRSYLSNKKHVFFLDVHT
ncbi:M14 family metallopeptidase, partial [bacterium]|nr:M14 family metallopeptidase [bacterium]